MEQSHEEALVAFERTFFRYPEAAEILNRIGAIHRHGIGPDSARCMLVVGPSGAGKSALIREYLKAYPEIEGTDNDQIPVLFVRIPPRATLKTVAEEILIGVGDPAPAKGTLASMVQRIKWRIRKLGVQLLILDEFQDLVERRGPRERIAYDIADWVKGLLNARLCPIVLVGTEDAELVVNTNPQLRRRCRVLARLGSIDFKSDDGRKLFRRILLDAQNELPCGLTADLSGLEIAQRLHYATGGFVGQLFTLLHDACEYALDHSLKSVDASVFDMILVRAGIQDGMVNPFRTATPPVTAPESQDRTPRTRFRKGDQRPSLDSVVRP